MVQIATLDGRPHVTEEKGQEQGADMRSVYIGISHDDDAMIADLLNIKIVAANTSPEGRDEHLDLLAAEHLFQACFLDIENLSRRGRIA